MKNVTVKPILLTNDNPEIVKYSDGSPAEISEDFSKQDIKKDIIAFVTDNEGNQKMFKSRIIEFNNKIFISPFPNPIHILINGSIDNLNHSVLSLQKFETDTQLSNEDNAIYFLNINEYYTNQNYNDHIRFRVTSIVLLIAAMESFLNLVIPNSFLYEQVQKNQTQFLDKIKIESMKVTFKEKLTKVISQVLKKPNFENENDELIQDIFKVYDVRRDLIHLKTNGQNELDLYFTQMGNLLDLNLENSISSAIKYMNKVKSNFIS